jgi:hypothetical protein
MIFKKVCVGVDVIGEFKQHGRKKSVVTLAFNERRIGGRKKSAEQISRSIPERRNDKEFKYCVPTVNLTAFDGAIAGHGIAELKEIGVCPTSFMARVITNLPIEFL